MIDLEVPCPGVGVRLGVHNNALLRLPRRSASGGALPPSRCSVAVLPSSGPVRSGVHSPTRRRWPPSSSSSASSVPRLRPRHHHHHQDGAGEGPQPAQQGAAEAADPAGSVLRLSLRKPGTWQWQVRTSASSPALVVPAVQLYDHRGRLLLDTSSAPSSSASRSDSAGSGSGGQQRQRHRRRPRHACSCSCTNSGVGVDDAEQAMAPALRSVPHAAPHHAAPLEGDPPPAHCSALVAEEAEEAREGMGSSSSRPAGAAPGKPGLLGRRTQSSGSLCTGARAAAGDKLGRLLAPCGRHRHHRHCHHHNGTDDHRHQRYKLCGSLPNRLDAAQPDMDVCDNNNMTPASPAASEKDLQDLGYASERSPDDEKHFPGDMLGACESVSLQRGSRGLGLSVCGGVDCAPDGLVRIKRLFPHQPAWQSGRLRPGDVLLAVNGEPLSGLTNHEALEVLRTAPDHVVLTVTRPARPPSWAPPPQQQREQAPPQYLQLLPLHRQDSCGELEVSLSKVQGSLGFTLRKEDSSALGHYVRALVREPALSDGRIRPGDKIVAVNGMDISHMTHEEAVLFLRQAGDTVHLRLYRDVVQTPVSALALSPTEARPKTLRKEALDMLSDLAVRRMVPRPGESSTLGRPRKVAERERSQDRAHVSSQPSLQHLQHHLQQRARTQSFGERLSHRSQELISSSQTSREQSPLVDLADSTVSSSSLSSLASVVERPVGLRGPAGCPGGGAGGGGVRRPDFLELSERGRAGGGGAGASAPGWHLQRLTLTNSPLQEPWPDDGKSNDFASLPCNSPDERARPGNNFSHRNRNPAYQSAHPACRSHSGSGGGGGGGGGGAHAQASHGGGVGGGVRAEVALQESTPGGVAEGRTGLLKWKGVVFTPEDDGSDTESSSAQDDTVSQSTLEDSNGQVFTVELNRGWNSRLGFSLQSSGDHSVISAIYNDSVAAKNGKLKIGDQIIMVNDESVEGMATANVIDLFRKIRGPIAITVWREMKV